MENSSVSLRSVRIRTPELPPCDGERVSDRQERVPGFDQKTFSSSTVLLVGAGGLGGEIGEGLVRKGIKKLIIFDPDIVELSNLNRQRFFKEDLFKNKALSLAKNLQKEGAMGSEIIAYPIPFEERDESQNQNADVLVCAVDNNSTRIEVADYSLRARIPAVFTAISADANHGYIFVQEPGKACWGCLFPDVVRSRRDPCPKAPAIKDILKVMAGFVLFSIDSLLMGRKRFWNYRGIFLDGSVPDGATVIERRDECPLCGKGR